MHTLTIHTLDRAVEQRIRARSKKNNKSLNQTVKELLSAAVGIAPQIPADHRADFAEFLGVWETKDARDFERATKDMSTVDLK